MSLFFFSPSPSQAEPAQGQTPGLTPPGAQKLYFYKVWSLWPSKSFIYIRFGGSGAPKPLYLYGLEALDLLKLYFYKGWRLWSSKTNIFVWFGASGPAPKALLFIRFVIFESPKQINVRLLSLLFN